MNLDNFAGAVYHPSSESAPFRNVLHGILYAVLMLAAWPFARIEASVTDDRFRARCSHRYGSLPPRAHALPSPHILIYCHSIGELRTSLLFLSMARERHPDWEFTYLFKAFEPYDAVVRLAPDITRALFVPLDAPLFVNRMLNRLRPDALVIIENDFRYHLITQAKRRGMATCLFSAEFSKRNEKRHAGQRFRNVLHHIDLVTVRDEAGLRLVLDAGAAPERVMESGNMRFDARLLPGQPVGRPLDDFLRRWREMSKLFVMGSTYDSEEEALFTAVARLRDRHNLSRCVVAPRRIHRAGEISSAAVKHGFTPCLRSTITEETDPAAFDLLVLDTMGELRDVYRFADFAFVGGSMVPRGGHNIYEAAEYGAPLLFGEHIFSNSEIGELLLARGCAWIVRDSDEIADRIAALLDDNERRAARQRCLEAIESVGGATRICLEQLELLLEQRARMGGESKRRVANR